MRIYRFDVRAANRCRADAVAGPENIDTLREAFAKFLDMPVEKLPAAVQPSSEELAAQKAERAKELQFPDFVQLAPQLLALRLAVAAVQLHG